MPGTGLARSPRILDDKFIASFGAQKPYDKEAFFKQKESGAAYTVVCRDTVTYIGRHGQWVALAEHLIEDSAKQSS